MDTRSPFEDRFDAHFIPSSTEREQIIHIISSALDKRSQIEEKIRQLCLEQKALDLYIEQHRAMISGIGQLPLELIQAIFRYCLPARNAAMSALEPPLLLGQVCSAWRQIAFTTPVLWSSLHLSLPRVCVSNGQQRDNTVLVTRESHEPVQRYIAAVDAWLQRSHTIPLSLSVFSDLKYDDNGSVNGNGNDDNDDEGGFDDPKFFLYPVLELLTRHSRRWKNFSIRFSQGGLRVLMKLHADDFPVLESLRVDVHPSYHFFLEEWYPHSPFACPSLRSVSFPYSRHVWIQWENLTNLTMWLTLLLFEKVFDVLRACSKLVVLQIQFGLYAPLLLDEGSVTVPALEFLRIIAITTARTDPADVSTFFHALNLPKLRHVKLDMGDRTTPPLIPLLPFFSRHNTIETLEYLATDIPSDELVEILTLCSAIKSLRLLSSGTFSNSFFQTLTPDCLSGSAICPHLQELHIEMDEAGTLEDKTLLGFLLARTTQLPPGVERLRRVCLQISRARTVDIMPDVQAAIEGGLRLKIFYVPPAGPIPDVYEYHPLLGTHIAGESLREDEYWDMCFPVDGVA